MFINIFILIFSYLILNRLMYAKKLEEIVTCVNETECDELVEEHVLQEILSTTIDNIHNTISTSTSRSTYPVKPTSTNISVMQTSHKIKYNDEVKSHTIHKVQSVICECDLTASSCDINCCCDRDCNDFHITVFSYCENHPAELYDKHYCYNTNFIERNNTPFILEKLANNLFCILYDNLPPTYSINNDLQGVPQENFNVFLLCCVRIEITQKVTLSNVRQLYHVTIPIAVAIIKSVCQHNPEITSIKTYKDLREATNQNKLTWIWKDQLYIFEYNDSSPYQDGDFVWILQNNYVESLEILQSGFTELCSFKKTVKYLRNWKNKCLQTELLNTNKFLFPTAFNDFTIIISPHLLNETYIKTSNKSCPKNVCLTPVNYYCKYSWEACSNNTILGSCFNGTCYNIVTGVKYLIIHNGSAGINKVNVYFHIGNISQSFYQQFEVSYEWAQVDKEKSFSLSGNPGYNFGKPLITGSLKINRVNNVQTKSIKFNKTNSFFTLPRATKHGECSEINRYTLAFGEDIKLKCTVSVHTSNFSTSSCIELQNRTMLFIMKDSLFNVTEIDQYSIYISKSGNFSNNHTDDWVQILLNKIPQNIITGQLINDRLYCSSLITSIHLDILYSALSKPKSLTNYNILGAGITFSEESDIFWSKCMPENCTDILQVDIISYVTFHDISKSSKYYFAGSPNFDLTLPFDFFYPFLNRSKFVKPSILLISIMFTVSLYNFLF